jgi:hypothetical protein
MADVRLHVLGASPKTTTRDHAQEDGSVCYQIHRIGCFQIPSELTKMTRTLIPVLGGIDASRFDPGVVGRGLEPCLEEMQMVEAEDKDTSTALLSSSQQYA